MLMANQISSQAQNTYMMIPSACARPSKVLYWAWEPTPACQHPHGTKLSISITRDVCMWRRLQTPGEAAASRWLGHEELL